MAILYAIFAISALFLIFSITKKSSKRPTISPSSPPSLPLIGHLHLFSSHLNNSFQNLSSNYGPLLFLRLGFYKCVLISSASLAAELFKANDVQISGKPNSPFDNKLMFGNCGFITSQYGEYWRFMKKLCVTELLGTQQIIKFGGLRREETLRLLRRFVEKASRNRVVDLKGEFMDYTSRTICSMANMGTRRIDDDNEAEKRKKLVLDSLELGYKINLGNALGPFKEIVFWLYGKQAQDVIKSFDVFLEGILQEHEDQRARREDGDDGQVEDMLDILFRVHRDEKAEVRITRDHVKAFIMDLLIAGSSTTPDIMVFTDLLIAGSSTTPDIMVFTVGELINRPDNLRKVRDEIESVVGNDKLVEEADTPSLPYLHAVIKEALRLYAPLFVLPRLCIEACMLRGHEIAAGTPVLINSYAIMRDPDLWENPNEFYPERHMKDPMKEMLRSNDLSFIPFGMGRRMCPGAGLALTTLHSAVAAIVQCFDWEVEGRGEEGKINLGLREDAFIVTTDRHPMCVPKVRFNPFEISK